ncbi:peptidase S8 and S53 subtilisin kexin sedolisin [Fictibacillus macauensis ZFHKF-1]|uniref:Peptidase S8 and S53 subtilisin kexin sedolisin n=1 Tax=Fictibacillus macauensis ZFHKF-1 TaxID=1196324 RepID=I8IXY3_9BACL|nr:S8 family serine peptidase [Fictibacillus macauensis]EIT84356.1 peptidase S8 and S53 subtilisin kexin sedolisin [Fictibacillus macauensis ZFHKF-1]
MKKLYKVVTALTATTSAASMFLATGGGPAYAKDHGGAAVASHTAVMPENVFKETNEAVPMNLVLKREIIVRVKDHHSFSFSSYGLQEKRQPKELAKTNVRIASVPAKTNFQKTVNALQKNDAIQYAEPNYIRKKTETASANDALFAKQYALKRLNWSPSFAKSTRTPVTVAILDCGVRADHPDMKGKVIEGVDYKKAKKFGVHGTRVAGVIAATINNKIGISGINDNVRIMPVRLGDNEVFDSNMIAAGIHYAVDHGAKIINMSFAERVVSKTEYDAILYAYRKGVTVVAASGNEYPQEVKYPAAYPEVIAASATNNRSEPASFTTRGKEIDLAAPGVDIWTTDHGKGNDYAVSSGTSYSSPMIAGLASLLIGRNPSLTPPQVEYLMEKSAYTPKAHRNSEHYTHEYGYGEIDIGPAMSATLPSFADDVSDTQAQAKAIKVGQSYTSKYDLPSDRDTYKLQLTGAKAVHIDVSAVKAIDPVIEVNGKKYDVRGPGRNEMVDVTLKSGTNYITIYENNSHWSESPYTLSIS